jgi:hypothetical protein
MHARKSHAFFDDPTAKVCIDQSLNHFVNCRAERFIAELSFAHPASEVSGLKNASHG